MDYKAYLASPQWKAKRKWALERAGNACQLCASTERLNVHHRTYENLGHEAPEDLIVLCRDCHARHHGKLEPPPGPSDWPLHQEIQAAKERLTEATGEPEKRDALRDLMDLHRERRMLMGEVA